MSELNDADRSGFAESTLRTHSAEIASDELKRLQERVETQGRRIRDLEQALDQSIASLGELRLQVIDQHFLEHQLATTEEIANVQQQAIQQLKLQFAQQKADLEAKIEQAQQRERDYQSLLDAAEQIARTQQVELDRLRAGVETTISQSAMRSERNADVPEQQLQLLQTDLELRRRQLNELEAQKQRSQARIGELEHQVSLLESQLARHMTTQVLLQQACQELETDREQSQHRIAELEGQAAEMQEQILSQAQQASEYETAVQHWKTRYQELQEKLAALKPLLGEADLSPEVMAILASIETALVSDPRVGVRSNPFSQDLKIDLPEFLVRRRTYRDRNS